MADLDDRLDEETARSLVGRIRRDVGESVRGATYYCGKRRTALYVREDIAEQYSDEEIECAIDDLALEAFGDPARLTDLYRLGDLEATARWFERGVLVHFPYSEASGVAVSLDHDVGDGLTGVISNGSAYLGDH